MQKPVAHIRKSITGTLHEKGAPQTLSTRNWLARQLRPHGRVAFLSSLGEKPTILDVGCGNNSPRYVKSILPNCYYVGLDVSDFNQSSSLHANKYIITQPHTFTDAIFSLDHEFDAIISSHNLEHCVDPTGTLRAMLEKTKVGGSVYLSFPCEASVGFPKRRGTLNFFDDRTHASSPPKIGAVTEELASGGFEITFLRERYRPFWLTLIGLLFEPISYLRGKVMLGTWELYGFQTIIWARKVVG